MTEGLEATRTTLKMHCFAVFEEKYSVEGGFFFEANIVNLPESALKCVLVRLYFQNF